jgi:hypothetical protein
MITAQFCTALSKFDTFAYILHDLYLSSMHRLIQKQLRLNQRILAEICNSTIHLDV